MSHDVLLQLQQLIIAGDADELLLADASAWVVGAQGCTAISNPLSGADALRQLAQALARLSGVRLDPMCGAAGGTIDDGAWRWHCVLPPLSRDGVLLSLRRHRFSTLTLDDFKWQESGRQTLAEAIATRQHILIVGATGSGKSSLLTALLRHAALDERVVIIESLPELPRLSPLWVRLAARSANIEGLGAFGLSQLLVEALRLRPDRLVIGEVRGPEAGTLVDALATGHAGVLATLHAGNANTAFQRLKRWDRLASGSSFHQLTVVEMLRGRPPEVRVVRQRSLLE